jgi:Ca2+/H+ antiporter
LLDKKDMGALHTREKNKNQNRTKTIAVFVAGSIASAVLFTSIVDLLDLPKRFKPWLDIWTILSTVTFVLYLSFLWLQ